MNNMKGYFDWAATSPPDPEIHSLASQKAAKTWGNPSSLYSLGKKAAESLEEARGKCAAVLGVPADSLFFTSGGTESDYLPLLSLLRRPVKGSLIVSAVEHSAVINQAKMLESCGWKVITVRPDGNGIVKPESVVSALQEDTVFVAVMTVNNETGAIQPVKEIAAALSKNSRRHIHFHTDAVQGAGKILFSLKETGVDSAAFSGHKLGGARGAGLLYCPRQPEAFISGGGQERGFRPGTENLYALYYDGTPNGVGQGSSSPFSGETGEYRIRTSRRREINQDLLLTFTMPVNDFHINALVGFNGNERKYSYQQSTVTNLTIPTWYNLSNSPDTPNVTQYSEMRRLMGVFGQFEGSWKDMVYLTVTARNDWSSTLPKENRSFFYPGVTGSFIFSELFDDELKDIITFGKVRASWGKTGNDADVYMINPVYAASANSIAFGSLTFPLNGVNAYSVGNILGSNTLSPEMTTEYEFGLNMAFLHNRISFDLAYYNRNSDKQIMSLSMDPATGYTAQNINLGKIRNHGIELLFNVTPIETRDFTWDVTLNFTKNWSKVISLPEELGGETVIQGLNGGTSMYAIVGQPVGVFKAEAAKYDPEGHIIVNSSTGMPVAADEFQIYGDMNNRYQMGVSTRLSYKGVSLSADFDIRQGGIMYSRTKDNIYFTGNAIQTAYNDRNTFIIPNSVNEIVNADGTVSYVENTTPITSSNVCGYYYDSTGGIGGDLQLVSKSFVKLRSIVLSWDLPKKWLAKTPLQGVRISAYGNNLFLWTPSSNTFIDPETTSFGNDLSGNYGEFSSNPSSRNFGINLNVKF